MISKRVRIGWIGLGVAAVLAILGGCRSNPYPLAPAVVEGAPAFEYLVGPGDFVNIQVWRNPELSMSVSIRPDGKLTSPLVEDLPASGKTPTQLARDIERTLSKYIQDPVVTVIVGGGVGGAAGAGAMGGPYTQQIRVIGQAARPQALAFREKMTLMDVLIAVGGITDFADGNRASIVRNGIPPQQLGVRLRDLQRYGDISANVEMRPGDVLIIPEAFF